MACLSLLTDIGAAQIAAALESGTIPEWTQMALGDGGGAEVDVTTDVTELVNQVYIGDLNSITVDEDDDTQVVCELLMDAEDGTGYTLREFGIYDADGNLVAYGSLPNIVKSDLSTDGAAVSLTIRAVVMIGNAETVQLLLKDQTYITADMLEDAIDAIDTSTADKLSTARTIAISGLVTGTATEFDGTADITIPVTDVSQADKLTTARTIRTNLASTSAASFNGTANITPGVTGTLPIAYGGTGNTTGLAASATKLATARTIQTNLASTSAASFDGTANVTPGVTGILAIANGGTGNSAGKAVTADALATARTIQTNLASATAASFDGSANVTPGVTGILPIANGGTGNSTGAAVTLGTSTVGSGINPIYLLSGSAKASTSTVGSGVKPVYLSSGEITASTSTVGSGTKPVYLSSGAITVSSSTVGSGKKPVYLSSGEITVSSSTVGSGVKPVYLDEGTITASTSTVGSGTKPVYLSSGAITVSSSTVGSGVKPVYLDSGTITASSSTVGDDETPVYLDAGTLKACGSVAEYSAIKKATNGYIKFKSSGIIIQWGKISYSSSDPGVVTFTIEFPTACLNVQTTYAGTNGSMTAEYDISPTSVTTTGFVMYNANRKSYSHCFPTYWLAIGY